MKLSGLFLSLVVIASCAATRAPLAKPWRVDVQSSGGFAGRGMGSYSLSSEGKLEVIRPNGETCTITIDDEKLHDFETVLGATFPGEWAQSYIPEDSCCDRFLYSMTFIEGKTQTQTRWIDAPPPMPDDLEALVQAMIHAETSMRRLADERCR
jgi:hypothetical protein